MCCSSWGIAFGPSVTCDFEEVVKTYTLLRHLTLVLKWMRVFTLCEFLVSDTVWRLLLMLIFTYSVKIKSYNPVVIFGTISIIFGRVWIVLNLIFCTCSFVEVLELLKTFI